MSQPNPAQIFFIEAEDLLLKIEEVVLDLNDREPDEEAINQIFRAFHTIKGSGAMFGFNAVADFTHHLETALDKVRNGDLAVTRELLDLVLAAKDQIKNLLEAARHGEAPASDAGTHIIAALAKLTGDNLSRNKTVSEDAIDPVEQLSTNKSWKIHFRPSLSILKHGLNPLCLIREIRELGEAEIVAHAEDIPTLDLIQPEDCYLWWEITLSTNAGLDAIKDVFIFVEDNSEIRIEEVAVTKLPATEIRAAAGPSAPKVFSPTGSPEVTPRGISEHASRRTGSEDAGVRVSSEKLDRLVNLVGELVMNQSRLMQAASRFDAPDLAVPVEEIERLISELRDSVLSIRMMPIGATFNRFKRLVHDLSAELGKEISLITEGAETELDKSVLDKLGDPLVHLIRNSIDHGIESAELRVQAGKPRRGTIRLSAAHTGSNVVVTIEDDGKGLDARAIHAKALERHLISHDAVLSEKEIFQLIFLPGFSTAKQITKVSGRGVGMDVVKRQVEALRGSVTIDSKNGEGTTISLTLPLTLAIIDGLLVEVEGDQYIIPMSSVTENVELHRAERFQKNGRNVISVRGDLVPYIRLREIFHVSGNDPEIEKIVIVRQAQCHVGIVVDRVLGSHQTVIQSLGKFYQNISLISGATIMGDGRVALILDTAGLIDFVNRFIKTSQESIQPHISASTPIVVERRI